MGIPPMSGISLDASSEYVAVGVAGPARTNEVALHDLAWNSRAWVTVTLPDGTTRETNYFDVAGGPVTVPGVTLPEGAQFTVSAGDEEGRYTIMYARSAAALELFLAPGVTVGFGDGVRHPVGTSGGETPGLRLEGVAGPVYLSGRVPAGERLVEAIPVRTLDFWTPATDRGPDVRLSTIRDGRLLLQDGAGKQIDLAEGEPIAFRELDGFLRAAVLDDGQVRVYFDGQARGIRSGYTARARSLMPSLLDWLVNIPWVKAVLALLAALIGSAIPLFHHREGS